MGGGVEEVKVLLDLHSTAQNVIVIIQKLSEEYDLTHQPADVLLAEGVQELGHHGGDVAGGGVGHQGHQLALQVRRGLGLGLRSET